MRKYLIIILLALFSQYAIADTNIPVKQNIVNYIDQNQAAAVQLLTQLVNINSQTTNLQGVRAVGNILQQQLNTLGFKTYWVNLPKDMQRAGNLFAVKEGNSGKRLLLIGHLDTVFPANVMQPSFQLISKQQAKGVGVVDMKGGDVVMLYALKALQAVHALGNATIIVALMGDEENSGKPTSVSRQRLMDLAKQSDVALDFESGPPSIGRRGISGWQLDVQGKQGHSSLIFQPAMGAGAIFAGAYILNNFREQLSHIPDVTFNPGLILGGTQMNYDQSAASGTASGVKNVIADKLIAIGDLRYLTDAEKKQAEQRMQTIIQDNLPQTSANITFKDIIPDMPPTKQNQQLMQQLNTINETLGYGPIKILDPKLRGAGDISFIAALVPAGLAGLGPIGQHEHSTQETIDLTSLPMATKRDALLIYSLIKPF